MVVWAGSVGDSIETGAVAARSSEGQGELLRQSYPAAVEALMKLRGRRLVFLARALDEARLP